MKPIIEMPTNRNGRQQYLYHHLHGTMHDVQSRFFQSSDRDQWSNQDAVKEYTKVTPISYPVNFCSFTQVLWLHLKKV